MLTTSFVLSTAPIAQATLQQLEVKNKKKKKPSCTRPSIEKEGGPGETPHLLHLFSDFAMHYAKIQTHFCALFCSHFLRRDSSICLTLITVVISVCTNSRMPSLSLQADQKWTNCTSLSSV